MQNTGAALFAVKRCSPARVRMAAQDGCNARGLLYLAAVWCVHTVGYRRSLDISP